VCCWALLPWQWEQQAILQGAADEPAGSTHQRPVRLCCYMSAKAIRSGDHRAEQSGRLGRCIRCRLLKRLRKSERWLHGCAPNWWKRAAGKWPMQTPRGWQVRAVDATLVKEPARGGSPWRDSTIACAIPSLESMTWY